MINRKSLASQYATQLAHYEIGAFNLNSHLDLQLEKNHDS